jgi:hypothetical protein
VLIFLLVLMAAGYFQTAKRVGGPLAETEETAMQPVPKPVVVTRAKTGR